MKKIIAILLLIINIFVFADIKIPGSDSGTDPSMVVVDGVCHAVYKANNLLYYTRSTNSTFTEWTPPNEIFKTAFSNLGKPSIVKSSTHIFVYWPGNETAGTSKKIFFSYSTNNGITFSAHAVFFPHSEEAGLYDAYEVVTSNSNTELGVALVSVTRSTPTVSRVLWTKGNFSLMTNTTDRRMSDLTNLTSNTTIFSTTSNSQISSLSVKASANSDFNVAFERQISDVSGVVSRVYYWNSSTVGDAAEIMHQNLSGAIFNAQPHMNVFGNDIHIVYQERISSGTSKVMHVRSLDGGDTWSVSNVFGPVYITNTNPKIHQIGSDIFALWHEESGSTKTIKYTKFEIGIWSPSTKNLTLDYNLESPGKISAASGTDRLNFVYSGASANTGIYFSFSALAESGGGTGDFPTVVKKFPLENSTGNDRRASVRVEFSADMNTATFETNDNIILYKTVSGKDSGKVNVSYSTSGPKVALLKPESNLEPDTDYTVSVSGVLDLQGRQVIPVQWSFKTAAQDSTSAGSITKAITYPNPYRGAGSFRFNYSFSRPATSVVIAVYDMRGRLVRRLESLDTGGDSSELVWDVVDRHGNVLGNGVYTYRIRAQFTTGSQEKTGKFIIAR